MRSTFRPQSEFQSSQEYALLPLRFSVLTKGTYLATNLVGEYCLLTRDQLEAFITHKFGRQSDKYPELKSKHFLIDGDSKVALDLLAAKYRTKLSGLSDFTGLHIFVTTLRCNAACSYCQVSAQSNDRGQYDMSESTADSAVDFMFGSPSPSLKVEFQGGEPLLNFPILQRIVERTSEKNQSAGRNVEFVVCTNLTALTTSVLRYIDEHGIYVSTSLDGPAELHDNNRPGRSTGSHELVVRNIKVLQETVGLQKVSALMTTTRASLHQPERIIDEYVRLGFTSIFLRILNPYGRATDYSYSVEEWLVFYFRALDYILELNRHGVPFREDYASIILRKMLTPYGTGFVDLQSPAGTGIGVMVYDHDGGIFPSDESRMLAAMGDNRFRLGDLGRSAYGDIVGSDLLMSMVRDTMLEGVPQCADCAFAPYCGADPVKHYRTQNDLIGNKPKSDTCKKNLAIMRHLIGLLESDPTARDILRNWI